MKYKLLTTQKFDKWFNSIRDKRTRFRVEAGLSLMSNGHFGDNKQIDANISELRFFFAGGLRIYFTVRDQEIIVLLNGGDKSSQSQDIVQAVALYNELER